MIEEEYKGSGFPDNFFENMAEEDGSITDEKMDSFEEMLLQFNTHRKNDSTNNEITKRQKTHRQQ